MTAPATPPTVPPVVPERPFDMNRFIESIINRNSGDKDASLRELGRDAKKARDGRNKYKQMYETTLAELQGIKKPGTVILSDEDATIFTAFKDTGIKLKDVKAGMDELPSLREFKMSKENEDNALKACKALGWKQPSVLLDLFNSHGLVPTFKNEKVKEDGGDKEVTREVPYVQKRGDPKAVAVKLSDYAEEHFAKPYHLALTASDEDTGPSDDVETPVPGSGPALRGKPPASRDVVGDHLKTYTLPGGIVPSAEPPKK